MIDFKNKIYVGSNNRKSLYDCEIPQDPVAVIVFVHGYKGFKDWGAWNLVQKFFVSKSVGFLKFNFSHNGGTVENPIDFDDLDAFGLNRYSYELKDLRVMIDEAYRLIHQELELDIPIYLVGHSRGGGVSILEGGRNAKVAKVVSWAGISDIGVRFEMTQDELLEWERSGVRTVHNGRTNQEMPHYYSFYEDYVEHKDVLNIETSCQNLKKPFLQIHGDMDLSVSVSEGLAVSSWTNTELKVVKGAEHTFGSAHPWGTEVLPEELSEVVQATLDFLVD